MYSLFHHAVVDQPVNVYQSLPKLFNVNHVDSVHFTPFIGDIVHELLPFPLNIMLYVFSVVDGVISTSFAGIANHVWCNVLSDNVIQLVVHPLHVKQSSLLFPLSVTLAP